MFDNDPIDYRFIVSIGVDLLNKQIGWGPPRVHGADSAATADSCRINQEISRKTGPCSIVRGATGEHSSLAPELVENEWEVRETQLELAVTSHAVA